MSLHEQQSEEPVDVREYQLKEEIDYMKIYSPEVRRTSVKVLLALVVQFVMLVEQLIVKTVFLFGYLRSSCVYHKWLSHSVGFFLLLCVVGIVIASVDYGEVQELKLLLDRVFDMSTVKSVLTKLVSSIKFQRCKSLIGVTDLNQGK